MADTLINPTGLPGASLGVGITQPPDADGGMITEMDRPIEQRLKWGTPFHNEILQRLVLRQQLSERKINERYDAWDQVDENVRLFLDLNRAAKKADGTLDTTKRENPYARSIVVPVSYALLDIYLTQLLAIYCNRDPIIQVAGRSPQDVQRAKIMEVALAYDLQEMGVVSVLRSLFQDAIKYGIGVIYDVWDERPGWQYDKPDPGILGAIKGIMGIEPTPKWGMLQEHNRWLNIDPFLFWPDPRVPLCKIQEGEFVGHRSFRSYLWVVERAIANGGPYFNTDVLPEVASSRQTSQDRSRSRFVATEYALRQSPDSKDKGWFGLDHMQIKLIPKDWGLGPGTQPEIWWFTWAERQCIVRAHRSDYRHGYFTYAAAESNPDPHTFLNPGKLEDADGMQRVLNWIVNTNLEAFRKDLNDAGIYNDDLLNMADVTNPNPGRWIRLTQQGKVKANGGMPLENMIFRFPPSGVGGAGLQLVGYLYDQFQRMFGMADTMQGMPTSDKRTLGEVEQINAAASQRIATLARQFDDQTIAPLARRAIANRQQFTSIAQWYRIPGDLVKDLGVDPKLIGSGDLAGDYDYEAITATLPTDPARSAQVWVQLLESVAKFPALAMDQSTGKRLNLSGVFNEAVRALGIRNMDQFWINVQPDAQVQAQAQAGNVVPMAPGAPGMPPGAPMQGPPQGMPPAGMPPMAGGPPR